MPAYKDEKHKTWYAKFRYTDWTGKVHATTRRGFSTKREALEYESHFKREQSGQIAAISFSDLVDRYLQYHAKRTRAITHVVAGEAIRRYILPFFGNLHVSEITTKTIIDWHDHLLQSNRFSQTTLRQINGRLSAIFNFARKYYDLPRNPVPLAGPIGSLRRERASAVWTPEQFKAFCNSLPTRSRNRWQLGFECLFWTGMRPAEMLALQVSDFDPDAGTLHISKSIHKLPASPDQYGVRGARPVDITGPKTESSMRDVLLPAWLTQKLQQHIESSELEANARIFPYALDGMESALRRLQKNSSLPFIRLYDFRHSHASYLISAGFDPTVVSERLGHRDASITLRVYSHLYKSNRESVARFLQAQHQESMLGMDPEDGKA